MKEGTRIPNAKRRKRRTKGKKGRWTRRTKEGRGNMLKEGERTIGVKAVREIWEIKRRGTQSIKRKRGSHRP